MATSFVAEVRLLGRKEVGLVRCLELLLEATICWRRLTL
jgi:hypothetical protein